MISYTMLDKEGKEKFNMLLPILLDQSIKKRHYYLFSKSPNFGKSTWLK